MKNIRNIGIYAHVDAGKTSLTELFLYHAGKIRTAGSVDKKNTQTDSLNVEKQRGITVESGIVNFNWEQHKINLIDTPGHIDFGAEVVNSVLAIDAGIVVISAVEGIQAQTENIIEILQKNKKPFLIFINKIDRQGANIDKVISELKNELNLPVFSFQSIQNEGSEQVKIIETWSKNTFHDQQQAIETLVATDEIVFENYMEDKPISFDTLKQLLMQQTHQKQLFPLFIGSAKYNLGITNLLHAIVAYLPNTKVTNKSLFGVVFKTRHTQKEGKWAAIRLFSGTIKSKSVIQNASTGMSEKINFIKNTDLLQPKILQEFQSGDIAWVQGLEHSKPGDFLGYLPPDYQTNNKPEAFLNVQVLPTDKTQLSELVTALQQLNNENPELNFHYYPEEQEFHIRIRGQIQQEIMQQILLERFGIAVHFSTPMVIYKETPGQVAEGFVRYWMPKPCWAIMRFKIEPAPRGSGVQFESKVSVNDVKQGYQNDVKKAIPIALQQGILGWQVDDVKITLIEGEDHEMHTKSNDFFIATPMGIMDGLTKANMQLLEPILQYKITFPETSIGKISSELHKARAVIELSESKNGIAVIKGTIPVATSIDFPIKLNQLTGGKAKYITKFHSYEICDIKLGKTRTYKGISPLDTAKYILKARKALS